MSHRLTRTVVRSLKLIARPTRPSKVLVVSVLAWTTLVGGGAEATTFASRDLIAFVGGGGIRVIPAAAGPVRRLTASGDSPVWSPNGKWIAFIDDRAVPKSHPCRKTFDTSACPNELYVVRENGSSERQITRPAKHTADPAWSPDASMLAVTRGTRLYRVRRDGTELRQLTRGRLGRESHASWSAKGDSIAFEAGGDFYSDIYVVTLERRHRRLTNSRAGRIGPYRNPVWSPDGRLIAYSAYEPYRQGFLDLFVMTPEGRDPRRITRTSVLSHTAVWSPDSSRVAYVNERGDQGIFTVDVKSAQTRRLTPKRGVSTQWYSASWSPAGDKLVAGYSPAIGAPDELWVMNSDGTGKRRLARRAGSGVWQPRGR